MTVTFGAGTSAVANNTTPPIYGLVSYISNAEYKQAPTGVDVSQLVRGDAAATEAELGLRIRAASGFVDAICGQSLNARLIANEPYRGRVDRDGVFTVVPRMSPLVQVTAFSFGTTQLNTLSDLSSIWCEDREFQVTLGSTSWSSAGLMQFGSAPRVSGSCHSLYSYVAGFPHTTLAASTAAGATSLQVVDATGVQAGTQMTIYDGGQTETFTVGSSYTSGTTLPTPALLYAHAQTGVQVSAMPANVKQATILLTSTLVQTRGAVALIAPAVAGLSARYTQSGSNRARAQKGAVDDNVEIACELLTPFLRTR